MIRIEKTIAHPGKADQPCSNAAGVCSNEMAVDILVTGANGQLGQEMRQIAKTFPAFRFDFTDVEELDLTDAQAVKAYCQAVKPHFIVNCAAYTAVDKAEEEVDRCYLINRDAVANLAEAAKAIKANLIHISTDYVFDGQKTTPYRETDPVSPVTVYGKSKLAGENALQAIWPQSVIIRTSWLYSPFGQNFVKTMIRLGREKDRLTVVADQVGSPTYAADLASAIMQIILADQRGHFIPGIYHYANEGACSWYEFTLRIHALAGIIGCRVEPVTSSQYPTKAVRPPYSVLDKTAIKTTYGITIPDWESSLATCIARLHD
jgi:dTDP-4-dehydrorhamnose reductase